MNELEQVEQAAAKAASARAGLEAAMREAWKKYPLRAIAQAAGISHEQVRRLLRAESPTKAPDD